MRYFPMFQDFLGARVKSIYWSPDDSQGSSDLGFVFHNLEPVLRIGVSADRRRVEADGLSPHLFDRMCRWNIGFEREAGEDGPGIVRNTELARALVLLDTVEAEEAWSVQIFGIALLFARASIVYRNNDGRGDLLVSAYSNPTEHDLPDSGDGTMWQEVERMPG